MTFDRLIRMFRMFMFKRRGITCGNFFGVNPPYYIYGDVTFGDNVTLNHNVSVNAGIGKIVIGNNVSIGENTVIRGATKDYLNEYAPVGKTTIIGNDVWIGANCTILAGVTIWGRAVIGAGSVVTKDICSNTVAVGNPCRVIKTIPRRSDK